MSDYASAIWMPVPLDNVFIGSGGQQRKWLVLHKTAGGSTAQSVAAYFQAGADGNRTSVHYIVGLDGTIVQCVAESNGAGGNCCLEPGHDPFWPTDVNLNLVTFSIECCDPTSDNSTTMPDAQKAALFPLVKDLCARHGIPMRSADAQGGIAGHSSIAPLTRKRCPGNFAWDELWAYLGGSMLNITDSFAAAHFTEVSPTSWHCKDYNTDMHDAILDYWRRAGGAFRLPRTNEISAAGVVFQVFECGILTYDPQYKLDNPGLGPVYAMHLDRKTIGLQKLMELAQVTMPTVTTANIEQATTTVKAAVAGLQVALRDLGAA